MKRTAVVALLALAALAAVAVPSLAVLAGSDAIDANTFTTATLDAASGLGASASCNGLGTAKVSLSWTATPSGFADGYDVMRSLVNGGPYSEVAHVDGRTTTTYVNTGLLTNTTYYYVVVATAGGWTSADSNQASATTPAICLS